MKAIRKSDGKVIEVKPQRLLEHDGSMYAPSELDFNVEDSEEVTIDDGWVARDKIDGELNIFTEIPTICSKDSLYAYWIGENGNLPLPQKYEKMFKSLDSKTIQEVTITIKPKKQ